MSRQEVFDERYTTGVTPWELDRPDSNLIDTIKQENIAPCNALEIGCGTGSNAIWMAQNGFDVTGLDFSAPAIEKAREKSRQQGADIRFLVTDFLVQDTGGPGVGFIFDRWCFHSFDNPHDRKTFAKNAAHHLIHGGQWLSILGNADAGPRDHGPPMRSALDIVTAVEPYFEILFLVSGRFDSSRKKGTRCWLCFMQKR
jgi:SAM-dependent methyltransferase